MHTSKFNGWQREPSLLPDTTWCLQCLSSLSMLPLDFMAHVTNELATVRLPVTKRYQTFAKQSLPTTWRVDDESGLDGTQWTTRSTTEWMVSVLISCQLRKISQDVLPCPELLVTGGVQLQMACQWWKQAIIRFWTSDIRLETLRTRAKFLWVTICLWSSCLYHLWFNTAVQFLHLTFKAFNSANWCNSPWQFCLTDKIQGNILYTSNRGNQARTLLFILHYRMIRWLQVHETIIYQQGLLHNSSWRKTMWNWIWCSLQFWGLQRYCSEETMFLFVLFEGENFRVFCVTVKQSPKKGYWCIFYLGNRTETSELLPSHTDALFTLSCSRG